MFALSGRTAGVPRSQEALPPWSIRQPDAQGPIVLPGGGAFVMSEVPLYRGTSFRSAPSARVHSRGVSLKRNRNPPRMARLP